MMATELADQCPDIGAPMEKNIPHTRASFKIQLTEKEMRLIKPEDIEESEKLLAEKKGNRSRLGQIVSRALDEAKKNAKRNGDIEEASDDEQKRL
ncbi:hypothetical protein GCK32_019792 [Trichostrongylus colubriformis]|uniref:Uncharacterized protein n=1 Tax=Trichostrongylus colubriformis TaxID=6319 RepID=A0AAN8FLL8_TRICO